ncbi:hypothetical protein PR048_001760 [Dryococelus australis]|uniref:RNA-directed DNA polymerase n=1 Tax=Dryococelus australis TaxID=614101 RepID=A0ABQ9IID3_9NEOP|nr:hypothetical protein PR048_001760 [Dryococelus australis]
MWGHRLVIPSKLHSVLLADLHMNHMGMVKTKSLPQSYFWWPSLDREIEQTIRNCNACRQYQANPPKAELSPWDWPSEPNRQLHADFGGPIDVFEMSKITAAKTVVAFRQYFCTWGLPT